LEEILVFMKKTKKSLKSNKKHCLLNGKIIRKLLMIREDDCDISFNFEEKKKDVGKKQWKKFKNVYRSMMMFQTPRTSLISN